MPKTVFEDENIIVFIKARGEDSEKIAQEKGYFPIHRLDRDTGGLMVMAKTANPRLSFRKRQGKTVLKRNTLR